MMNQCLFIHGWATFDSEEQYYTFLQERELSDPTKSWSKKWKETLSFSLPSDWQMIFPEMPSAENATYKARTIRFEKHLPYLTWEKIVLIGHSLWWRFLCKRLSENNFPKKINQLHLVAACISADGVEWEGSADFGFDYVFLPNLEIQCDEIFLYHSRDDEVVPYEQVELLKNYLPKATLFTFETRNHFFQPAFPELLENMKVYKK
jgi:predicted alpha/beta hydrolase family esterase